METLREAKESAVEIEVRGKPWYYFKAEAEVENHRLDEADLLRRLSPDLALRVIGPGRFAVEGHVSLPDVEGLLEQTGPALTEISDGGDVVSVTVEPHDYEMLDLPLLYLENR